MQAHSSLWQPALAAGYTIAFKCELLYGGAIIANNLVINAGKVSVDYTASIMRRGTIDVLDPDGTLAPKTAVDKLSPYGHEIRPYRGITYWNGVTELMALGTLRIAQSVDTRGVIQLTCYDRSRSVSRARFETAYVIASGTNYATAIQSLIADRLPSTTFRFTATAATTPLIVFDQMADPWASAQTLANAIGCDLFFDPMGICVLQPTLNPATANVVSTYKSGNASTLIKAQATMTDDPGYNGIVIDAEPPGATPIHSAVYDTDPTSPTYYLGPYGKVPEFQRTTFITTQQQADNAGIAEMLRNRGGTEQVKATVLPDPAQEASDLCYVYSPKEGIDANYIIESFDIPLTANATSDATFRKRRSLGQ